MSITVNDYQVITTQKGKIVNAAVDWITLTTDDEKLGIWMAKFWERVLALKQAVSENYTPKGFSSHGYTGLRTENFTYAVRDGSSLVTGSGAGSSKWVEQIPISSELRCTRVDICVDIEFDRRVELLSTWSYEDVQGALHTNGLPVASRLIKSSDRGSTLYVGRSGSQRLLRIYDKGIEQGSHPSGQLWRYELQLRSPYSTPVLHRLQEVESKQDFIISTIVGVMLQYDMAIPKPLADHEGRPVKTPAKQASGLAKKRLEWLQRSVVPCIANLIGEGYRKEVVKVLSPILEESEDQENEVEIVLLPEDGDR